MDPVEVHAPAISHPHVPGDPLGHEKQPDFWETPGDSLAFFTSPSIEQNPAPGGDILALVDQLSNP